MKTTLILLLGVSACFWGCSQRNTDTGTASGTSNQAPASTLSKSTDASKTEDQVMALHDQTMQKLDTVMALKKSLKTLADQSGLSKADNDSIDANLHRLQKSDDDMMDWMNHFQEPDKMMAQDKVETYLKGQLKQVEAVNAEMNQSMAKANHFIAEKKAK